MHNQAADCEERAQGRRRTRAWPRALGGIAVLTLLLGGCAADATDAPPDSVGGSDSEPAEAGTPESESPESEPASTSDSPATTDQSEPAGADASAGEATFSIGGREFVVELTTCGVYENGEEVVLGGHAKEVGGAAAGFLDGDLTTLDSQAYGEFRLDIGAGGPFESSDEFLALGDSTGGNLAFSQESDGNVIVANGWNEAGEDLGEGSLAFMCS